MARLAGVNKETIYIRLKKFEKGAPAQNEKEPQKAGWNSAECSDLTPHGAKNKNVVTPRTLESNSARTPASTSSNTSVCGVRNISPCETTTTSSNQGARVLEKSAPISAECSSERPAIVKAQMGTTPNSVSGQKNYSVERISCARTEPIGPTPKRLAQRNTATGCVAGSVPVRTEAATAASLPPGISVTTKASSCASAQAAPSMPVQDRSMAKVSPLSASAVDKTKTEQAVIVSTPSSDGRNFQQIIADVAATIESVTGLKGTSPNGKSSSAAQQPSSGRHAEVAKWNIYTGQPRFAAQSSHPRTIVSAASSRPRFELPPKGVISPATMPGSGSPWNSPPAPRKSPASADGRCPTIIRPGSGHATSEKRSSVSKSSGSSASAAAPAVRHRESALSGGSALAKSSVSAIRSSCSIAGSASALPAATYSSTAVRSFGGRSAAAAPQYTLADQSSDSRAGLDLAEFAQQQLMLNAALGLHASQRIPTAFPQMLTSHDMYFPMLGTSSTPPSSQAQQNARSGLQTGIYIGLYWSLVL